MKRILAIKVKTTAMNERNQNRLINASKMVLAFYQSDYFKYELDDTLVKELRGESKSSISQRHSGLELYQVIMSGREEWNNVSDYVIDLEVRRYFKKWSSVIGYIIPMKPTIWVNGKFFDTNTVIEIASNLCHEYLHTLGFRHSGKYIEESLPYLVNKWFKAWIHDETDYDHHQPEIPLDTYETLCTRSWYTLWLFKNCYKVIRAV